MIICCFKYKQILKKRTVGLAHMSHFPPLS
jgi:hypothetical protein